MKVLNGNPFLSHSRGVYSNLLICPSMLSFFQRHYGDEDPEKEQKVKEIERLLMATENELKIKPSLSVSKDVCLGVKL